MTSVSPFVVSKKSVKLKPKDSAHASSNASVSSVIPSHFAPKSRGSIGIESDEAVGKYIVTEKRPRPVPVEEVAPTKKNKKEI